MIQIQLQRFDPHAMLESNESASSASSAPKFEPFGEDGLTFSDVFDAVNPLHHIPIVGSIYRKITGDQIDPAMRIAGGALFGGPIGALVSAATLAVSRLSSGFENSDMPPGSVAHSTVNSQRHNESFILTSASNRQTEINRLNDQTVEGKSKLPASSRTVEMRPGGWMVIHAYGENHPDPSKTLRNSEAVSIAVAV